MKIESNIQSLLSSKGKVFVPNLGTFTTAQASAEVTESGGVIAPPQAKVLFTEEDEPAAGTPSLKAHLIASGQMSESDAELEIESFTNGIKHTVGAAAKAGLGSLGHFQEGTEGLTFISSTSSSLGGDSFGLPKLSARPLVPVPVSDNLPAPSGNDQLLLKAILIPLIIIAVVLVYFLLDKEAYSNFSAYFSSDTPHQVDPIKKNPITDEDKTDKTKADQNKVEDNTLGEKEDLANKDDKTVDDQPKPDDKTKDNTKTDDGKSNVVTTTTSRFYIIIGSFTNDKAAEKAVAKCKKVGYADAKILKMNNKIRVSVEDYSKRSDAMSKAEKVGKDFPGAWVLAN